MDVGEWSGLGSGRFIFWCFLYRSPAVVRSNYIIINKLLKKDSNLQDRKRRNPSGKMN